MVRDKDRQTGRDRDKDVDRETARQRQIDSQTERETNRRTDRQTVCPHKGLHTSTTCDDEELVAT